MRNTHATRRLLALTSAAAVIEATLVVSGCAPAPIATPMDSGSDVPQLVGADGTADALIDGATSDQPAGDAPAVVVQPSHCFDGMIEQVAEAGLIVARSPHDEVRVQGSAETAVDYARTLEAAYPAFTAFFGAEPRNAPPLVVKVFRDGAAFTAGLTADGLAAVGEAGGFFSPQTRTAYLHFQPTRYYSRVLLLHEATHQFHFLTRTANQQPAWYVEGLAEYLGRHDWDGRCVRLGVRPLLSQEDTPRAALAEVDPGVTFTSVIDGAVAASRPVSQEVVRYLATVDSARLEPAFRAFRRAVDRGDAVGPAFSAALGAPASHDAAFRAFVPSDQEPMAVVFLEWTHVDSTTLIGNSPGVFSIARVKTPVAHFETVFQLPAAGTPSAGVLIGYQDAMHWEAVVVRSSGRLARFVVDGGATWNDFGAAPAPQAGGYRFQAEYSPGRVTLNINGRPFVRDTALPPVAGPAVDSAEVRFQSIAWR